MPKGTLARGSTARIYRDGEILVGQLLVPQEGRFEVRHLPPGSYLARDETGEEVRFEVSAFEETTVICGSGSPVGPTGAPASGHAQRSDTRLVGRKPAVNEHAPHATPGERGKPKPKPRAKSKAKPKPAAKRKRK